MSDIKLLALDLDGTLLGSDGLVPERNVAAIRAAELSGVTVTIATGRRFRDARPIALEVDLNGPVLTHNGALVKNPVTSEALYYDLLSAESVLNIIEIGRVFGGDPLVSTDPHGEGQMLYETVSETNTPLRRYIAWSDSIHGEKASDSVVRVDDLSKSARESEVVHISYSGTVDAMREMEKELLKGLESSVNILATVYPDRNFTLLDILPAGSSKASGLNFLANRLGIERNQILAVGDNHNDLEMLEFAGIGVLMGNADACLLTRPEFYTTLKNDDCGVAEVIERFILGD